MISGKNYKQYASTLGAHANFRNIPSRSGSESLAEQEVRRSRLQLLSNLLASCVQKKFKVLLEVQAKCQILCTQNIRP
jgi:hypothetical protein